MEKDELRKITELCCIELNVTAIDVRYILDFGYIVFAPLNGKMSNVSPAYRDSAIEAVNLVIAHYRNVKYNYKI